MKNKSKENKSSSQVQLFKGKFEITRSGMGFVIVDKIEQDILVKPNDFGKAFHGDIVRVQVPKFTTNKRAEGKIVDVVEVVVVVKVVVVLEVVGLDADADADAVVAVVDYV
jgi:ribonuclease R